VWRRSIAVGLALALSACAIIDRTRTPRPRPPTGTSEEDSLARTLRNVRYFEKRQYWINFVPFGMGQFQNGRRGKGIAFAGSQGAAAATSIGVFVYLVNRYGYGGKVPRDEASEVRRLQQIQLGASIAFAGLAAWGIVDALRDYEPVVEITPTYTGDAPGVAITWSP
jgi:hypothetical protein